MRNSQVEDRTLDARDHIGHVVLGRVVEHHCEFLAAVARDQIQRPARALTQGGRDRPQAFVAGLVAVAVVEVLETIDVGEQNRDWFALADRHLPDALHVLVEGAAVLDTGQAVACDHLVEQSGLEEPHAARAFVHVDGGRADEIDGDEGEGVVGAFRTADLEGDRSGEIRDEHDRVRDQRVIKDEAGEEVDVQRREQQSGEQEGDAAARRNQLDRDLAQAEDGRGAQHERPIDPMPLRRETCREHDQQHGNDQQNVDQRGQAAPRSPEHHCLERPETQCDRDREAQIRANRDQRIVEMRPAKFGLEFGLQGQPRNARAQLPRIGRVRQVIEGQSAIVTHHFHNTVENAVSPRLEAQLDAKRRRADGDTPSGGAICQLGVTRSSADAAARPGPAAAPPSSYPLR